VSTQAEHIALHYAACRETAFAMFEDAEWMLDAGESFEGVLRRLDTSWEAFSKRMTRYEQTELRQRMIDRRIALSEKIGV
jgi:hypothetical protein